MGTSRWQILRTVQLPMARRTIIVGLNQCTMAALSMATIAALINGPGPGPAGGPGVAEPRHRQRVRQRHRHRDHGDRAGPDHHRGQRAGRGGHPARAARPRTRRIALIAGGVVALICVYLSRLYLQLAEFPAQPDLGAPLAAGVSAFTDWLVSAVSGFTGAITNLVSNAAAEPAAVAARGLAVVADGPGPAGPGLPARRLAPGGDRAGLRADHPGHRAVEREHEDAHHHAGRHPGGDRHRDGRRGVDGAQPAGRHRGPPVPGRVPDHPAVRLPGAGAGAVRDQPVHRDRRRRRVRRPGGHQADRRRHPRACPRPRSRPPGRPAPRPGR